ASLMRLKSGALYGRPVSMKWAKASASTVSLVSVLVQAVVIRAMDRMGRVRSTRMGRGVRAGKVCGTGKPAHHGRTKRWTDGRRHTPTKPIILQPHHPGHDPSSSVVGPQ